MVSAPNNSTDKSPAKKIYCGWSGEASKPLQPNSVFIHGANGKLDVLEMDPQWGMAVGLQDGQKVYTINGVLYQSTQHIGARSMSNFAEMCLCVPLFM